LLRCCDHAVSVSIRRLTFCSIHLEIWCFCSPAQCIRHAHTQLKSYHYFSQISNLGFCVGHRFQFSFKLTVSGVTVPVCAPITRNRNQFVCLPFDLTIASNQKCSWNTACVVMLHQCGIRTAITVDRHMIVHFGAHFIHKRFRNRFVFVGDACIVCQITPFQISHQ
jgi:hypothetical protein